MDLIQEAASWIRPVLNLPLVKRIRRNHAYEHATVHMLNRQNYILSGRSDGEGFVVVGDVPTEKIEKAAQDALKRLQRGEKKWAVHPNCGTNLVTAGVMTALVGALGFMGTNPKRAWERFPIVLLGMMFAVLFSQPIGMKVQEHITTESDPGDLEYVQVEKSETIMPLFGKQIMHRVRTRKG